MDKAQIIFESYNLAVEDSYNKAFNSVKPEELSKLKEANVDEFIIGDLEKWASTPIADLGGVTPSEYFNSISDFYELEELFRLGARICDRDLPVPFIERFMFFGDRSVEALVKMAADCELIRHEEDFYISLMAIRILGRWKIDKAATQLLELIYSLKEDNEIVVEEITDAFINMGEKTVEPLVQILDASQKIGYADEYILTALVKIGMHKKSDKLYRCIKDAFYKMEDKVLGAMCLGDYGDGRAIPGLKGYVEKNWDTIDKATYLEIIAAITHLGGNVDDIMKYEYLGKNYKS